MSPTEVSARSLLWRTINAGIIGLGAGVGAVVVVRAVLGPAVVVAGAAAGLGAMLVTAIASWIVFAHRSARRHPARLPEDRPVRRHLHPVAWFAPVVGSMVAILSWAAVAHSSGSGWVQAVGALLAAVLLTGMIAPGLLVRGAAVACTGSPSDGEAGRTFRLTMEASGPIRVVPRYPLGQEARAGGPPRGQRTVDVTFTPARRGVLEQVVVELATCAPFGLLWWAREVEVVLPRPLHVAPRRGEPSRLDSTDESSVGDAPLRVPSGAGEPRGVRPYQPGDSRRSVHWPATSHVGSLMVREKERQVDDPIVVQLSLPADRQAAEAESERMMGALTHYLIEGRPVVLGTDEVDGRVTRVVRDRIDLGRRLARAVTAPTPTPTGVPGHTGDVR